MAISSLPIAGKGKIFVPQVSSQTSDAYTHGMHRVDVVPSPTPFLISHSASSNSSSNCNATSTTFDSHIHHDERLSGGTPASRGNIQSSDCPYRRRVEGLDEREHDLEIRSYTEKTKKSLPQCVTRSDKQPRAGYLSLSSRH